MRLYAGLYTAVMRIYAVISAWGEYETDLCGLWYFDFGSNGNDAQFSQSQGPDLFKWVVVCSFWVVRIVFV